jgi:hypothetical protein
MNKKFLIANKGNVLIGIIGVIALIILGLIALTFFYGTKTIADLLSENKKLKESLTKLTQEDQIGYAKVIKQERQNGKLFTTLKFVETARDDKTNIILEKEYTIEGDVIHFDAMIIKFSNQLVIDGKERSMFLWRRVYGENMAPNAGYPIEDVNKEPMRYQGLLKKLDLKDREMFWSSVWELSNDAKKYSNFGIQAVFGNVVYSKLKPKLIYVFKISNTGQLYPEIVPEM